MKFYKAFNRDLQCRDFQYKEGDTYEIQGELKLCSNGFCKDLVLTLQYYPVNELITENKFAEIEVLGDLLWEEPNRHKGCTDKIKIIRVLPDYEVLEMVDKNHNSGNKNSGYYNSGNHNSGYKNSGNHNSGYNNSGNKNSGNKNSGNHNSGYNNSGNKNSGDYNSGDYNSGYNNSGNKNSGYYNSGNHNSGYYNSGNHNSGYNNSGYKNSGDYNSGNHNSGDWNSTFRESGFFNSTLSNTVRVFNKECPRGLWDNAVIPSFLYFDIKDGDFKKSFQDSYNKASDTDKKLLLKLPNFDSEVFYEISGIDLREDK